MNPGTTSESEPIRPVENCFDRIARRYDAANRVISLGRDGAWRRALAAQLYPGNPEGELLDAACGTGDQLLALVRSGCRYQRMTGFDVSNAMLEQARRKSLLMRYAIRWVKGPAEIMPFPKASFDAVTMTFGLRNLSDRSAALAEIRRVLKPNGRLAILEFSLPPSGFRRFLFNLYLSTFLPWAGGLIAGNLQAYQYLALSIRRFPPPKVILQELTDAGFEEPRVVPVDPFGVYLYLT